MFGVCTEDFIPVGANNHLLSLLILKKGKAKEARPSKPMIKEITEELSRTFIPDNSDSMVEIPT